MLWYVTDVRQWRDGAPSLARAIVRGDGRTVEACKRRALASIRRDLAMIDARNLYISVVPSGAPSEGETRTDLSHEACACSSIREPHCPKHGG